MPPGAFAGHAGVCYNLPAARVFLDLDEKRETRSSRSAMQQPPQPPPPYPYGPPPAAPPKKGLSGWAIAGIIVGGGCFLLFFGVAILGAILFPVFAQAREKARQSACLSNLKQMSMAMRMYALDHNGAYPASAGWMYGLDPYVRRRSATASESDVFRCPSVPRGQHGYAMNSRASGANLQRLLSPATLVTLYDSRNLARNASDPGVSLPTPPRHGRGNNLAYADGRVKWTGPAGGGAR